MLLGLAGVALPLLAHLISRRKYDVIQWGAMQFLELGYKTRRRIRLEELLLLLLRMAIIALIAAALARPWIAGGVLGNWLARQSRDVVIVIDGSYSMGWEGKAITPHAAAVQWAQRMLDDLGPGDTVALLDARDQVRNVIDPPVHDVALARRELDGLPPPTGSSDLLEALISGIRVVAKGTHPSREVVLLTDGQRRGWSADDAGRWELLDDLQQQQTVKPRIWVINVNDADAGAGDRTNFSLDRLQLSREFAAVNLPVRIKTKLKYSGGVASLQRGVHLEVDGQRLGNATVNTPMMPPGGEFSLEFEHRFTTPGSHLLSVVIDADNLPGDNRADAAVTVAAAIPIGLVDGDPHLDRTRSESFFAQVAYSATDNDAPLVQATVLTAADLTPEKLAPLQVVCLMNVPELKPAQADAVMSYVAAGGGLLVAPGDKVQAKSYNDLLFGTGQRVLPAKLEKIALDEFIPKKDEPPPAGVTIQDSSLTLPLVTQLKRENDGGFTDARFSKWWRLFLAGPADEPAGDAPKASEPIVAARLTTLDAAIVLRNYGRGRVAQLAFPLDSDWSTLPAKSDFVPLLHELAFHLAGGAAPSRNVQVGEPLLLAMPPDSKPDAFVIETPQKQEGVPALSGDDVHPVFEYGETSLPGVYTLRPKADAGIKKLEQFVVNFDRAESDLTPLKDVDRTLLAKEKRLTFVQTTPELASKMSTDAPRAEVWRFLMLALLLILAAELFVTRRMVKGGHHAVETTDILDEADAVADLGN